jgi:hypothetical protein
MATFLVPCAWCGHLRSPILTAPCHNCSNSGHLSWMVSQQEGALNRTHDEIRRLRGALSSIAGGNDNGIAVATASAALAGDELAKPTPDGEKGMWRKRGDTLLSQCIYLMEQMFMESLNGVLCQCEDERCEGCQKLWADLKALMDRYDAGER